MSLGSVTTAKNKVGATPLHLACQFKHINMVKVNIFRVPCFVDEIQELAVILQTLSYSYLQFTAY